ncbi:MAG: FecR domain-containing protein, partial [Candidatus Sericytochromatia bacterium]|nr:FecR domain-containing protein [Candidatus Tanganyikabacteria bacterium]
MKTVRLLVAAGALAALGAAGPGEAADPAATVLKVKGPVDVRLAGAWRDASAGDRLASGDAARTGRQGFATLRDPRGTVTELFPLTHFEVPEDDVFRALAGTIWTHFRKLPGLEREIRTPSAVALIRGTTLAVTAGESSTRVTVYEGLVEVRDLAGKSGYVPEGYAVRADRSGLGPVERALPVELEDGRRFLDRNRDVLDPPVQGGLWFPGLRGGSTSQRPTALERAEAAHDRAQAASGGPRGPADGAGPGTGRRPPESPGSGPRGAAAGLGTEIRLGPGRATDPGRAADAPGRLEGG